MCPIPSSFSTASCATASAHAAAKERLTYFALPSVLVTLGVPYFATTILNTSTTSTAMRVHTLASSPPLCIPAPQAKSVTISILMPTSPGQIELGGQVKELVAGATRRPMLSRRSCG
ncbi:unnamed protein product [Peniophora sp. CBMAI 1063]|nr:unnamed protein product [Peniophora sp. CBMAI 1063]